MGKHNVEEDGDLQHAYVVATVETTEGPAAAVVAFHDIIGERLAALLTTLEVAFGGEVWYDDPDELFAIGEAYTAYMNSPGAIMESRESVSSS